MENETNKDYSQQGSNPQNVDKEYPGYTPDPQSGAISDDTKDSDTKDSDADARLAAKGPIRNPNYHDLVDKTHNGSYTDKGGSLSQKTLQDFNKTDPKRDINTADVDDKSRPSGIK